MLGTRIILMGMDNYPDVVIDTPKAEMVCAANHRIPFFWLLLFSVEELEPYKVAGTDSETYPVLIVDRLKAVKRLQQRYTQLAPFIDGYDKVLLQRWLDFISELYYPVVAIDTYELWRNSADPSGLYNEIVAVLDRIALFATAQVESEMQILIENNDWSVGNGIALAGFGW